MNIFRKTLFVSMMTSSLSLITSVIFFHQFEEFFFETTLILTTIYLMYMVGGVFVAIFKETTKTFPEEWAKESKFGKIMFILIIITGIACVISVFFQPFSRPVNIIIASSLPVMVIVYLISIIKECIVRIISR